jgi:hypothetical protein
VNHFYCRECGADLATQPYSRDTVTGKPYCEGCEPLGVICKRVIPRDYEPREIGDAWSGGFAANH